MLDAPARTIGHDEPVQRGLTTASGWRDLGATVEPLTADAAAWTIVDLLRAAVDRDPSAPAIVGDETVSYRDLDERSDAVGAAILDRIGPGGGPVAVLVPDTRDAIVAALGAAKAGRPYCVIDATAPVDHQTMLLGRLGADLVATSGPASVETEGPTLDLRAARAAPAPAVTLDPRAIAAICFTSGSTGSPKGVIHDHRSTVANALRVAHAMSIEPGDRAVIAAPLQYLAPWTWVYASIARGAAMAPYTFALRGTREFPDFARAHSVTLLQLVPAHVHALVDAFADGAPLPHVRLVNLGGDRMEPAHIEALRRAFPGAEVVVRYSTSETNWISGAAIPPDAALEQPVTAGWPVPWASVEVRDADGHAVPHGTVGEVVVGGDHLALGYWRDPARTADRFRDGPSGREYRTGDRARWRDDGQLQLAGREDATIKVRGVLVDRTAVEHALTAMPEVRDAAVVSWIHESGATRLTAFVESDGDETTRDLRRRLAAVVPSAMVPSDIQRVDALPVTSRGKVDRDALATRAAAVPARRLDPPRSETERILADAFAEVLGLESVGRDEDFYALGGDSLAIIELAAAVHDATGQEIEASTVIETPTPASMAARLDAGPRAHTTAVRVRVGRSDRLPLFSVTKGGGLAEALQDVAPHLDRTVYAMVGWGLEHRTWTDHTVRTTARRHVHFLRAIQPSGPYLVGGRSSGGVIAFEMAQQLRAAGETVLPVVLFDTGGPKAPHLNRFRGHIRRRRDDLRSRGASLPQRWLGTVAAVARSIRTGAVGTYYAVTAGVVRRRDLAAQQYAFRALRRWMLRYYRPRAYDGDVLLLHAATVDRRIDHRWDVQDLGWAPYVRGDLIVVDVPGNHETLVEGENGRTAAAVVERELAPYEARALASRAEQEAATVTNDDGMEATG